MVSNILCEGDKAVMKQERTSGHATIPLGHCVLSKPALFQFL